MIEIDTSMFEATKQAAREQYITDKVREYELNEPTRFERVGQAKFREFIELSLQKGEQYNMQADREVNGLRIMMYFLGSSFDEDPMLPWAQFKRFPAPSPSAQKTEPESFIYLQNVYNRFHNFLHATTGPDFSYTRIALKKISTLTLRDIALLRTDEERLAMLKRLNPQRYDHIPQETLCGPVLKAAFEKSMQYGFDPVTGKTLFTLLIFYYGIGFDIDPLYCDINSFLAKGYLEGIPLEQQLLHRFKAFAAANTEMDEANRKNGQI